MVLFKHLQERRFLVAATSIDSMVPTRRISVPASNVHQIEDGGISARPRWFRCFQSDPV